MGKGGFYDFEIPVEILDQVVSYLCVMLQRGDVVITDIERIKTNEKFNLDLKNDWWLFQLPGGAYRLGARYESQELVDNVAAVLTYRFVGDIRKK